MYGAYSTVFAWKYTNVFNWITSNTCLGISDKLVLKYTAVWFCGDFLKSINFKEKQAAKPIQSSREDVYLENKM